DPGGDRLAQPARRPGHGPVPAQDGRRRPHPARPGGPAAAAPVAAARVRRPAALVRPHPELRRHRERDLPARVLARDPGPGPVDAVVLLHALPVGPVAVAVGVLGTCLAADRVDPGAVLRDHGAATDHARGGRDRLPCDDARPGDRDGARTDTRTTDPTGAAEGARPGMTMDWQDH